MPVFEEKYHHVATAVYPKTHSDIVCFWCGRVSNEINIFFKVTIA